MLHLLQREITLSRCPPKCVSVPAVLPASGEAGYGLNWGNGTEDILKNCSECNDSRAGNENAGLESGTTIEMD